MFVIAKGYYGLGGNIAVLACAMRLAKKLNRQLIVDWKDGFYGGDSHDAYASLFQSPTSVPIEREALKDLKVWPNYWQPYIAQTKPHANGIPLSNVTAEMAEIDIDTGGSCGEVIVVSREDKYWHQGEHHEEMGLLTRLLIPSADVQKLLDSYKQLFAGHPVIGVHFRHGNGERSVVPPDISWFFAQVDKFIEKSPESKIFLCTDCHAALTTFSSRYGNRVLSTEKEYPPLGTGGMHYAVTDDKRLNSAREALLDIWLLAECTYFVGSRSFFSAVAGKLNGGFDRNNSAWWMPKYRSHSVEPGKVALAADEGLAQSFLEKGVMTDGVYYEGNTEGAFDLYYLYDYLGTVPKSHDEFSLDGVFAELRNRRLY